MLVSFQEIVEASETTTVLFPGDGGQMVVVCAIVVPSYQTLVAVEKDVCFDSQV